MKLTQLIAQYVAFRKSLGQDFESDRKRLATFSRFVGESAGIDSVKPQQVAAFLTGRESLTGYWHLKYRTLRAFFSYAVTRGYLSTSPLPATVPKPPARFVPQIYSREELRRLLDGTASYQKHKTRIVMEPRTLYDNPYFFVLGLVGGLLGMLTVLAGGFFSGPPADSADGPGLKRSA